MSGLFQSSWNLMKIIPKIRSNLLNSIYLTLTKNVQAVKTTE